MKKVLILNFFLMFSLSSCKKVLDFSTPEYYTISQIVKSKNCKAKCKKTPACENKVVKVKALLDELNVFPEEHRFFIMDEKEALGNQKLIWEVRVSPSISEVVFQKIKNRPSLKVELEGKISSFDAPMNTKCIRLFQLSLKDSGQISFY